MVSCFRRALLWCWRGLCRPSQAAYVQNSCKYIAECELTGVRGQGVESPLLNFQPSRTLYIFSPPCGRLISPGSDFWPQVVFITKNSQNLAFFSSKFDHLLPFDPPPCYQLVTSCSVSTQTPFDPVTPVLLFRRPPSEEVGQIHCVSKNVQTLKRYSS